MRYSPKAFILSAAVLISNVNCAKRDAASHGRAIPYHYQVYRSSEDWDVEVWINKQPAMIFCDARSGWYDVTPYVVNGTNSLQVRAKYRQGASGLPPPLPGELKMSLDRVSYPGRETETLFEIAEVHSSRQNLFKEASFEAEIPITWAWQRADDLPQQLGDADQMQVMSILEQLAGTYEKRDPRAGYELCARWWSGSQQPDMSLWHPGLAYELNNQVEYSRQVRDWTVHVAQRADIRFTAGTKLLCLTVPRLVSHDSILGNVVPSPAPVIRAGPPPQTPDDGTHATYGYFQTPVFLVKVKGAWRVLYWDWFL